MHNDLSNQPPGWLRHAFYVAIALLLFCAACASLSAGMVFLSEPYVAHIGPFTTVELGLVLLALGGVCVGGIFWLRGTYRI